MPREILHRRDFGWQLLGGLSGVSAAAAMAPSARPPAPAPPEEASPEQQPPSVEFLLLTALLQRYPNGNYDEDAVRGIYGDILGDAARGKSLRSVSLKNADEPACCFRPFRAAEKEP
jgi:hypothetical protein